MGVTNFFIVLSVLIMPIFNIVRLLLLAAIWGSSFLFMRIMAPVLGALWTAELRVTIAGIAMLVYITLISKNSEIKKYYKQYLVVGTLNSALPFALFSYAALTLPTGYSAIMNATTPLWGAIIAVFALGEKMTLRKLIGLLLGVFGVSLLVRLGPITFTTQVFIAALACATAACLYAIAGIYTKKYLSHLQPSQLATGSLLAASFVLMPFLPFDPIRANITPPIIAAAFALALMCSAIAYLLYFRLIQDLGPTRATTVTFLIPLFAMLWGVLFLHEAVNHFTFIGIAFVIGATILVSLPAKTQVTS